MTALRYVLGVLNLVGAGWWVGRNVWGGRGGEVDLAMDGTAVGLLAGSGLLLLAAARGREPYRLIVIAAALANVLAMMLMFVGAVDAFQTTGDWFVVGVFTAIGCALAANAVVLIKQPE